MWKGIQVSPHCLWTFVVHLGSSCLTWQHCQNNRHTILLSLDKLIQYLTGLLKVNTGLTQQECFLCMHSNEGDGWYGRVADWLRSEAKVPWQAWLCARPTDTNIYMSLIARITAALQQFTTSTQELMNIHTFIHPLLRSGQRTQKDTQRIRSV